MDIDSLYIPDEPEQFKELCEKTGLALMLGQKVHVSLCYYYSVFHVQHGKLTKEEAKEKLDFHLSKVMGVIIKAIKKDAPLDDELFNKILEFKDNRNWLAHDFDQEAVPALFRRENLAPFISKIDRIAEQAYEIMRKMDHIGEELTPIKTENPCRR